MPQLGKQQQNAASKALSTQEIIASVIDAVGEDGRLQTLQACTLVNSSWKAEARRRLWEHCGLYVSTGIVPGLNDLFDVEPSRRQDFANYVKELRIYNLMPEDFKGIPADLLWQGQFLAQMPNLSFPRLECIYIEGPPGNEIGPDETPNLEQLAGPCLKKIVINSKNISPNYVISQKWIASLTEYSKGLKQFSFFCKRDCDTRIPSAVLASFLRSLRSLVILRWDTDHGLSASAIEALAQISSLRLLQLAKIQNAWIGNLDIFRPEDCFRSLVCLECVISGNVLAQLLPFLHHVKVLDLRIEGSTAQQDDTRRAVQAIADITPARLSRLLLQPGPDATIHSADILKIAKNALNLTQLNFAFGYFDYHDHSLPLRAPYSLNPHILGLDDDFIESLSPFLSKITSLFLISNETKTSERALIALGRHCHQLRSCTLTAKLNFEELLRLKEQTSTLWHNLRVLNIFNGDVQNQGDESNRNYEDMELKRSCERVADAMTSLHSVSFESWVVEECINNHLAPRISTEYFESTDEEEGGYD